MYSIRLFAVRQSRAFEQIYSLFEKAMIALDPLFIRIGYSHLERPVAFIEKQIKGVLFDCRMCGQCVLSSTGMSCPMNCPKSLRNGPCGGVRPGGYCEVTPEMKCVWVLAWDGARHMKHGDWIHEILPPVDRSLEGSSSWLRVAREKAQNLSEAKEGPRNALARAFPSARSNEPATAPLAHEPQTTARRRRR